jgi:hypothetical protein
LLVSYIIFTLWSGIPAEDFLCVPEPNENECLPSGLDGDETAHKQVSKKGPVLASTEFFLDQKECTYVKKSKIKMKAKTVGIERS